MVEYIDKSYRPDKKDDMVCEYFIEPNKITLEKACEHLAGESSIGTWTDISTMSPDIAKNLKPHVYSIDKKTNTIKVAYNRELFEDGSIPQILSSVAGNIYGMKALKSLRLLDITFPKRMIKHFPGPRHGIQGIRKLLKVKERPLTGTIVKPKVGLSSSMHANVAYNSWAGGLDIVKDDENLTDQTFNRFEERVIRTLDMRDRAESETGEKKVYMPNITAETAEMIRRADFVKDHGGEYIMIDIVTAGFSGLQSVRRHCKQVIHGHRAMHAALTRNPNMGMTMLTLAKLSRLAGTDQLHIGTAVGKMEGSAADVSEIGHEIEDSFIRPKGHVLEQDWEHLKPVFAVCSGGMHPGIIPPLMKNMGKNIIIQCGGGVHGHPDGTTAGATAVRQAVDAVMKKKNIKDYAKTHRELDKALEKWGTG
ncbi:MAG: type III ribulose-bisphosphate carboxylase [Candidatus Woesearchaeota archaeon]